VDFGYSNPEIFAPAGGSCAYRRLLRLPAALAPTGGSFFAVFFRRLRADAGKKLGWLAGIAGASECSREGG
jgi:hypothetical protein